VHKPTPAEIYEFDEFRVDAAHLMLYRMGQAVHIAPKAVEVLAVLIERRGEIVSKDELFDAVWRDTIVDESNVFFYLSLIRKALGRRTDGSSYIETLRRRGYRFNGDVHVVQAQTPGHFPGHLGPPEQQPGEFPIITEKQVGAATETSDRSTSSLFWLIGGLAAVIFLTTGVFFLRSSLPADRGQRASDISVVTLTSGDDVHAPAISRDGKFFAYHTLNNDRYTLMLQPTGQLKPVEIFSTTELGIGVKTFSPAGNYVYFGAGEIGGSGYSVYRIPTRGGPVQKVLSDIAGNSGISFSPDGSEFVFSRTVAGAGGSTIVTARADGTEERDVYTNPTEALAFPAWSPDGRSIAFARYVTPGKLRDKHVLIEAVPVSGGEPRRLVNEKLENCFLIAWASDGDGLVFNGTKFGEATTGRRDQVWFISLKSQTLTRISPEGTKYVLGGLTAANEAIAGSIGRTSQVWSMDATGVAATAVQLTRGTTDGRAGLAPLPSGRVAFTTRNGDNWELWVVNEDGSDPEPVFTGSPTLDELRVTPDGKYFLFKAEPEGNDQLFRLGTDGRDLKQLTFGEDTYVGDSSPSADGTSVIYRRVDADSLYRLPIDGGEQERIEGTREMGTPYHSPDGKYISYVTAANRLAIASTVDVSKIILFDLPKTAVTNVGAVWTPDSRSLAYIVYENKVSNVWLQPITGGPPRKLTDFTSGHIYRIAYSTNGRRLYLARGYATNNAFLFKGFADR
jgi:DNA-binding winged helix-turn-helix (wHTH) protein/Tol biopolymer transport system component